MMRFYSKMLATLAVAMVLQILVCAEGGWNEVSFEAQCLVRNWRNDPALHEEMLQQAERLLQAERETEEMKMSATVAAAAAEARPGPTTHP